jgi:endonuclease-3
MASTPSRTSQLNKVHKVLKKHYKPVAPDTERPVLDQLLFACCLENAPYGAAEEAFAALVHNFFDWNEVRVSSIRELGEVMGGLPEPPAAAHRVKRVLQSVFESTYSFELEDLRKMNLGPAVERLGKIDGTTGFSVAYVVQSSLGGHSIPVDTGTLRALYAVDLVTEEDGRAGVVPGLERAIPKNKGIEFGSLLHQLGADFIANPYTPAVRDILLEINPDVKDRLPKRRTRKEAEEVFAKRKEQKAARREAARRARRQKAEEEAEAAEAPPPEKAAAKKKPTARKKKPAEPPPAGASADDPPEKPAKKRGRSKKAADDTPEPPSGETPESNGEPEASSELTKKKPR